MPFTMIFSEYETYNVRDYEAELINNWTHNYPGFNTKPVFCTIEMNDLSEGTLLISFYEAFNFSMVTKVYIDLIDEKDDVIWSYSGSPEESLGLIIKNRYFIQIEGGDYHLDIVCDNVRYLGLKVRFSSYSTYLSSFLCCCGTPSLLALSIPMIACSFLRKKSSIVKRK